MVRKIVLSLIAVMSVCALALAQNKQVSGTVTGPDGTPIAGATVLVDGSHVGTTTSADGSFSIAAPANGKLAVSFIGYKSEIVPIAGKTHVGVALAEDTHAIDDVIVVAFGTAKKEAFTGSAGVMKSEQLEKRQVSDVSNALSGVIAGVQTLNSNGQPGTGSTVRIRGVGSLSASNDPLYVVDGIPYSAGSISAINTQDIESITVLKDAASNALYGARGANGVIMITTKRGKSADAVVTLDAKVGVNSRAVKNYDVLRSPAAYYEKAYEAIYNSKYYGKTPSSNYESNAYANSQIFGTSGGGLGYQVYTVPNGQRFIGLDGKVNPQATLGYLSTDKRGRQSYYTPDNWEDAAFQNNIRQEYNASISGRNEKFNYYMSFGYLDDKGLIDNSGFKRYSTRAKMDYQAKKWLKVGASLAYSFSDSAYPGEQTTENSSGNAFYISKFIAPIYPLYVRGGDGQIMRDSQGRKIYDFGDASAANSKRPFMSISNPIGMLYLDSEHYYKDVFSAKWYAAVDIYKGLTFTANMGINLYNENANILGNKEYGQSASYGGSATVYNSRDFGFNQQYLLTYVRSFGAHSIDLLAGFDAYSMDARNVQATGQNLYNPNLPEVNNTIDERKGYSSAGHYATQGILFRAGYNYDQRYFMSASYRRDASSRFHPDNRWGNFWSLGGAWVISHEKFMAGSASWLDMLKFKASFGQQGNDAIGNDYAYVDQYTVTGSKGVFATTLSYKGNKDLTWETSNSFNTGFEFSFWKSRLAGSIEYFSRQTSDMLYNRPVPTSLGYSSIPVNVGSMRNSGIEIDLNGVLLSKKNFNWSMNVNATHVKNKILKLAPELDGELIDGSYLYTEGESMYRRYMRSYAGVNPATGEALYYKTLTDGSITTTTNWSDATRYGTEDLLPKLYGGFGTSLSFYGVDVSVSFAYQFGGKIYDSSYAQFMHAGDSGSAGTNWHKDILNSWSETNTSSNIPRVNSSDLYANSMSDRFLVSSDYLSINNITVGYTLPKTWVRKMGVSNIRVYFTADNVGVIAAREGLDPRMGYYSSNAAVYSAMRTLSGGLSVTF